MMSLTTAKATPAMTAEFMGLSDEKKNLSVITYHTLLPEQQRQVDKLVASFNPAKSTEIVMFGSNIQEQLGAFSRKILTGVQTKDSGEIGQLLVTLVTEVKTLKPTKVNKPGFLRRFFREKRQQLAAMKAQYESVDANIQKVKADLTKHINVLFKDINTYEELADRIQSYHADLTLYVVAIDRKIEEIRAMLPEFEEKAKSEQMEDVQNLRQVNLILADLDRKKYDLEMSLSIAVQEAIQARGIAAADTALCTKTQSAIVNTIPAWQTQAAIAIGLKNNENAHKYLKAVSDATSEMIKQNAKMFHDNMVESAKRREEGIISVEAYTESTDNIIATFTELLEIQKEGERRRIEARSQILDANERLHGALLALRE